MSLRELNEIVFILSLIGGIIIFVSGILSTVWFMSGGFTADGMIGGFGVPFGFMGGFSFIELLLGVSVIIGAPMLNIHPS